MTATQSPITGFCFTYALMGGAWIDRADGSRNWESFDMLAKEKGHVWIDGMLKRQGYLTGTWIAVPQEVAK